MKVTALLAIAAMVIPHPLTSSPPPSMTSLPDATQLDCLAKAVYFEAGIEPLYGMYMVSEVIMQRTKSGKYPNTPCAVIQSRRQFASLRHVQFTKPANGRKWNLAKMVAAEALGESAPDYLDDNVYHFVRKDSMPSWTARMHVVAQTDNHVFLKP